MTTTYSYKKHAKVNSLAVVMTLVVLLFSNALLRAQSATNNQVVTAISPTKMNVLYSRVDNPVNIAVAGVNIDKTTATVDNGTIQGGNGEYIINPETDSLPATVKVFAEGKEVKQVKFRVKRVPNPVASIMGIKSSGKIRKQDLLKQDSLTIQLENFDFDVAFKIIEFTVSATIDGFGADYFTKTGKITAKQKELISRQALDGKIFFEDIRCIGPGGEMRYINPIILTLTE